MAVNDVKQAKISWLRVSPFRSSGDFVFYMSDFFVSFRPVLFYRFYFLFLSFTPEIYCLFWYGLFVWWHINLRGLFNASGKTVVIIAFWLRRFTSFPRILVRKWTQEHDWSSNAHTIMSQFSMLATTPWGNINECVCICAHAHSLNPPQTTHNSEIYIWETLLKRSNRYPV